MVIGLDLLEPNSTVPSREVSTNDPGVFYF